MKDSAVEPKLILIIESLWRGRFVFYMFFACFLSSHQVKSVYFKLFFIYILYIYISMCVYLFIYLCLDR